jgi:hypothetical protein
MTRTEFSPGEVLLLRSDRTHGRRFFGGQSVLEDSRGETLAWMTRVGSEAILPDGRHYYFRSGPRATLKVIDRETNEQLIETRRNQREEERVKFRGHDLHYSLRPIERKGSPWQEGSVIGPYAVRFTSVVLTLTYQAAGTTGSPVGRAVVGDDILGADTTLTAALGFVLLREGHRGCDGANT